jgi:hypothetical protein
LAIIWFYHIPNFSMGKFYPISLSKNFVLDHQDWREQNDQGFRFKAVAATVQGTEMKGKSCRKSFFRYREKRVMFSGSCMDRAFACRRGSSR